MSREPIEERENRQILYATFWVHKDAISHGRTRPYHWTDQCVRGAEGENVVEISREEAEANPKLRPCKLCASGGKVSRGPADTVPPDAA